MKRLTEGRFEDAVIAASVALSATARREYPAAGDKAACRAFLEESLPILQRRIGGFRSIAADQLPVSPP